MTTTGVENRIQGRAFPQRVEVRSMNVPRMRSMGAVEHAAEEQEGARDRRADADGCR